MQESGYALTFRKGLRDGIPIALGYLSVSFAFGILVTQSGLPAWVAALISMTNLTSAGQVAGLGLIVSGGLLVEIAVTTAVINLRYLLMSLSLSQKLDPGMPRLQRCLLAFGNTDEIFAVAMQQPGYLPARYLAGLILTPYWGWAAGTLLGATAAELMPGMVRSALGIALYGMFVAIIVPAARRARPVLAAAALAGALSCVMRLAPGLRRLSPGWVIIVCAVAASAAAALRYPVTEKEDGSAGEEEER